MKTNIIRTHHSPNRRWTIHHGDVQQVLPTLPIATFDGVLTDPPYGLKFMGQDWDDCVPPVSVWQELLRACKSGAYLIAFGAPRNFHRLACNIEDAGWEIRDTLCWLYGEGFPKSHNIGKAVENKDWDGYGTALKPAWEPIILAMKPIDGNFAENALARGTGGLNIDGSRIGSTGGTTRSHQAEYPRLADGTEDRTTWARSGHTIEQIDKGRWPANVILDEETAGVLAEQSGDSRSRRGRRRQYQNEGGASRFFYVAKANSKEREGNEHPTVKPLALCEYLARLILQPERKTPRRLLVPFSGSGSEMVGALAAGWDHVTGIEWHGPYVATARRRLASTAQVSSSPDSKKLKATNKRKVGGTGDPQIIPLNSVIEGDCRDLIPAVPDKSVNLCLTSPPYADQRKGMYPGVPEREYPAFTVEWMSKLWDKMNDDGSVLVVIDPKVKSGVLADYVLKTRLALRESGWMEHQSQIWLKRDRGPLGHKNWPRHCYEQLLWFSKSAKPFCDPRISGKHTDHLTMNDYAPSRWTNGGKPGKKGVARVTNVWDIPVGNNDKGVDHPAKFPVALPKALVQTFCSPSGVVLDNFCGSGSTLIAAKQLGHPFYGFDIKKEYVELARRRLDQTEPPALTQAG